MTGSPAIETSFVTLACDYGNGEEVTTVVPTQTPDAHDTLLPSRGLAVSPLGAAPLCRAVLN